MKILIAEDDLYLRNGIEEALQNNGFMVVTACNGAEALEQVKIEQPDLICLDIMMPKMDGYEVCKKIRKTAETPIIFMSAKSEEIDKVVALELGGDDYLSKPFGIRELIARIKAVARRTKISTTTTNFQINELFIDCERMEASVGSKTIPLSFRDIAILRTLYENRGQAISKKKLYETCWQQPFCIESRTLDQHISQLRKKLEEPNLIKTVHGVGYMTP